MKILAIESSAGPASCAVWEERCILASAAVNTALTHSQTLLPMVSGMLSNAGLTLTDIDAYAVSAGPGSFTGIRIGVSAVKGMAFSDDKPCFGVSTLAAIARNADGLPFDGVVCAVMDAPLPAGVQRLVCLPVRRAYPFVSGCRHFSGRFKKTVEFCTKTNFNGWRWRATVL